MQWLPTEKVPHQYPGAKSNLEVSPWFFTCKRQGDGSLLGQSDSTSLHCEITGDIWWNLFNLVRDLICWLEEHDIGLSYAPVHNRGKELGNGQSQQEGQSPHHRIAEERNWVTDSLSRKGKVLTIEWTFHQYLRPTVVSIGLTTSGYVHHKSKQQTAKLYRSSSIFSGSNIGYLFARLAQRDHYVFSPFTVIRRLFNNFETVKIARWLSLRNGGPKRVVPVPFKPDIKKPRPLPLRQYGTLCISPWGEQ